MTNGTGTIKWRVQCGEERTKTSQCLRRDAGIAGRVRCVLPCTSPEHAKQHRFKTKPIALWVYIASECIMQFALWAYIAIGYIIQIPVPLALWVYNPIGCITRIA